jgi:hypothetical protein
MAFCTNCGTQVADGVKFCTSCGTAIGASAASQAAPTPPPPTPNNTGAGNSDYQQIDPYEFYLGRKKGRIQSGKFVLDLLYTDCDEEDFTCYDPKDEDTEFTFEITKRPPELESDDPITVYIHCEGDANPIIDNIVVRASAGRKEPVEPSDASYRSPAPSSGAGTADSIAGLGREMTDQLKNAAKEQLNKLNPLKGLFGKK